jgi:nitrate/TMAO reductase-like tetraheme cytochrome c subunit
LGSANGELTMIRLFSKDRSAHFSGLALLVLGVLASATALAGPADENEECLSCHGQEDLSKTMKNGEEAPLFMKHELLEASVHKSLRCTDCHAGMDQIPHAERDYESVAKFRASFGETCKNCHLDSFNKSLNGMHHDALAHDNVVAPTCVTCHGSHDIARPAEPRSHISQICATCHAEVSQAYAKSVHGKSLIEQNNQDVPTCTDCHQSHDIADTKNRAWLASTPSMCGKCHADEKRMKKYGLSTAVLSTYLSDFHGMTTTFGMQGKKGSAERMVALCGDCHGVHDVAKVTGASAAAFRGKMLSTCQKCHPGVSANFPSAWLSHREPSLSWAPGVYLVNLFYKAIIPFIVIGLILQIVLHLWRAMVNR